MPLFPPLPWKMGFPGGSEGKASACNAGDPGSIPGLGRSPGEGNDNPPQYSCLENSMDGESRGRRSPRGCQESDTTEWLLCFLSFIKNSIIRILVWQLLFLNTPYSWVALSTTRSDCCSCVIVLPLLSYCFNNFFFLVFCSLGMGLFYFFPRSHCCSWICIIITSISSRKLSTILSILSLPILFILPSLTPIRCM